MTDDEYEEIREKTAKLFLENQERQSKILDIMEKVWPQIMKDCQEKEHPKPNRIKKTRWQNWYADKDQQYWTRGTYRSKEEAESCCDNNSSYIGTFPTLIEVWEKV